MIRILTAIIVGMALSACSGVYWDSVGDAFTPGVSPETKERTWDENGKPKEKTVQNDPAYLYDSQVEKQK